MPGGAEPGPEGRKLVGKVTRIRTKGHAPGIPPDHNGIGRYIAVLHSHGSLIRATASRRSLQAGRTERDGRVEELQHALDSETRQRQELAASLKRAEDELQQLRQRTDRGGGANGLTLEEELKAKEEELNRIKSDYATKMKNSLALQRIKYEREIDALRKELRKLTMGRDEVTEELSKREQELTERENRLKHQIMELNEQRRKLEADAEQLRKASAALAKPSPELEERIRNLENEVLRYKTSLEVKTEALKRAEEQLAAKEAEFKDYMAKMEEQLKQNDLKAELENVKKGSIAMMKYITSLQQKKQEEEFKAIRKALENEIQKRLQIEEELRKKEESLAARQRALGAEIERVASTSNVDLEAVRRLEAELRMREEEVRRKEEALTQKEKALVERIKGLEGEIQKKIRDGRMLADIKREFALKAEELNLLRMELKQKEEELQARERALNARAPPPAGVPKNVEAELKRLRDELASKEAELKRLTEPIKYKEQEFLRREEDLRYREELLKREMLKLEEARKQQATIEESELKKRLEALEEQIKHKEEEIKSRESYLRKKEEELRLRESRVISKEIQAREEDLRLEVSSEKAKTGNSRLDDLLMGGIPFGSNVLCIGPPFIGKEVLVARFLLEGLQKGIPAIVVTTDISPQEIREELNAIVPGTQEFEKLGLLRYIDVYSKSMGLAEEDPATIYVDSPTDYAGITRAIEMLSKQFREKSTTYRMAVRSISTLVTYSDPTSTYKFLQMTTGRVKRAKVVAMYTMDRGMHSETEIQTLAHLMDGSIEFKTDGVKTYLSVQGLTDVQSRAWIQYTYTKKGLNIGSFALDHIR
ncbi:MAG: ATPase domain-containing protein [Thermoplasmata archaeon]